MDIIQKKIDGLIKKYNTANPFTLCEYLDIKVFKVNIPGNGIYNCEKRIPMIYINDSLPYHKQMAVCAHELAHHLLHRKYNAIFFDSNTYFKTNTFENEANNFSDKLMYIYYTEYQGEMH